MYSPTRQRFLNLKKQKRAERERQEGMIECRGTIEARGNTDPCGMGLRPRRHDMDSVITCHRCRTIHVKTAVGWRTRKEAKARDLWPEGDIESWVR